MRLHLTRLRIRSPVGALLALLGLAIAALAPVPAGAATIRVTTHADDLFVNTQDCSLREAVRAANIDVANTNCPAGTGTDTILVPAGTYNLTRAGSEGGTDVFVNDLDVNDPDAGQGLNIRAVGGRAIIHQTVADRVFDVLDDGDQTVIEGLTIEGGHTTSSGAVGGGIRNFNGSALTVIDSVIRNNRTDLAGGGGIGGVNAGSITLENVTVSGNRAGLIGGGVLNNGAPHMVTIHSSTIAGNIAEDSSAFGGGGGVAEFDGVTRLRDTLVAGNSDANTAVNAPDCWAGTSEMIESDGNNLIAATTGCSFGSAGGDLLNKNARIGPLADNGGDTFTHSLLAGSPAIDKGSGKAPSRDQRGISRKGPPDIGAYERRVCRGVAVNRIGTNGREKLIGTPGPDGIYGFGGKDVLKGKGGADGLCGHGGKDRLLGGPGGDQLAGGSQRDTLLGGGGRDLLIGGRDSDRCVGAAGRDRAAGCEARRSI